MRLVLIRQNYRADGGGERFVARAAAALGHQGIDVTLLARTWPDTARLACVRCDPWYLGGLWRDISFARCVCHRLRTLPADLVQSHERIPCCDIFRAGDGTHREWLIQRRRTMGPWGRWRLRLNPRHGYAQWAERQTLHNPRLRAVICGSTMVRDEIIRHFHIDPAKIAVLHNGVDCDQFHPRLKRHRTEIRRQLGIEADRPVLLFVGSGFQRKGLATAIRALAQATSTNAGIIVVGRDKRPMSYRRLARRYGVANRLWLVGAQSDPRPFYGAADALVLPAIYDPSPTVILEAMACGLPVIASRQCGTAELLVEGESGFVCDALDIAGLAAAVTAVSDPATAARMGAAARAAVLPYDLRYMGERFVAFYRTLLATPARDPQGLRAPTPV